MNVALHKYLKLNFLLNSKPVPGVIAEHVAPEFEV